MKRRRARVSYDVIENTMPIQQDAAQKGLKEAVIEILAANNSLEWVPFQIGDVNAQICRTPTGWKIRT